MRLRWGALLVGVYMLYVFGVFLMPRVVQWTLPPDDQLHATCTVRDLEQAWYGRKMAGHPEENLYQALRRTSDESGGSPKSPTLAGAPYAHFQNHPCAKLAGWVAYSDHRTITGLSRSPEERGNSVLCIDFNGPDGPNRIGTDIYYANFNPTGDFDTRTADHAFDAGVDAPQFNWGDFTHAVLDRNGHSIPGVTLEQGPLGTLLYRR